MKEVREMKKQINFHGVEVDVVFAEGTEDLMDHTMRVLRLMASRVYEARGILHVHFMDSKPMTGDDPQAVAFNRVRTNVLMAENTIPWVRLAPRNCVAFVDRHADKGYRIIAFKAEIGPMELEIVSTVQLVGGAVDRKMTVKVIGATPKESKPAYELPAGVVAGIVAAGDARIEAIDKSMADTILRASAEAYNRFRRTFNGLGELIGIGGSSR
jgi:hypothetical protein